MSKTYVQTARLMTIILIVQHTENDTSFNAGTINSPVRLHALKTRGFLVEAKQLLVEGPQSFSL